MGRPPKTNEEKAKKGTLQKCRVEKTGGHKALNVRCELSIEPPVGLTKEAREVWIGMIQSLPEGHLTIENLSVFERWCRNYVLYRRLAREVEAKGAITVTDKGDAMKSAEFLAMMDVQTVLGWCEKQLGFTPSSRAGVRASIPKKEEEKESEFKGF